MVDFGTGEGLTRIRLSPFLFAAKFLSPVQEDKDLKGALSTHHEYSLYPGKGPEPLC